MYDTIIIVLTFTWYGVVPTNIFDTKVFLATVPKHEIVLDLH